MFDFSSVFPAIILIGFAAGLSLLPKTHHRKKSRHSRIVSSPVKSIEDVRECNEGVLATADMRAKPLMNASEYRVFSHLESLVGQSKYQCRVFAKTSLGEVFRTSSRAAFRLVNSKRVDFLITDAGGMPIAAIEYQGGEQDQKSAVARDAIKREAFRLIDVPFIEVAKDGLSQDQVVGLRRLLGLPVSVAAE